MENYLNLELIKKNRSLLVGKLFTAMQFNILKKKLQKKTLNSNEKTYYYKFIKPKILAMMNFFDIETVTIRGKEHILEERMNDAIVILKKIASKHKGKKIMISGSFLFKKNYNDIDVFVFTKYDKVDYKKGKLHINYLPESSLESLFFASISSISISNFVYSKKTSFNITTNDVFRSYENIVYMLETKQLNIQDVRSFLVATEYYSKGIILNPKQLSVYSNKVFGRKIFEKITQKLINDMTLSDDKKLKEKINIAIKELTALLKKHDNAVNFKKCINTYRKVIELAS